MSTTANRSTTVDRPTSLPGERIVEWGSDVLAEVLRDAGLTYIALTPGSSFRGLHDSLVNHLGNVDPQMLLCLHEENAVAIAHGYAKVAERPIAVALHTNVGLLHASMAIFGAFCDRVPMLIVGATGPVDASRRRPWIDWVHTTADNPALVRPFIKWDDQPISVTAAADSLVRAHLLTSTAPCAPTYVCFDVTLQEERVDSSMSIPSVARFGSVPAPPHPAPASVERLADILKRARKPVILAGRGSRSPDAWAARVELAERLNAQVFAHLELPASFPSEHPLSGGSAPHAAPSPAFIDAMQQADVVLSLDWLDLGGTLRKLQGHISDSCFVVSVSLDHYLHNGWSKDHQASTPADLRISASPDVTVAELLENHLRSATAHEPMSVWPRAVPDPADIPPVAGGPLGIDHVAAALRQATKDIPTTLARVPSTWTSGHWDIRGPLDYLGGSGGAGLGTGPGMAVGAALALQGSDRLPLAILGDGDFLMGVTAVWTAAHYRLPLLLVVMNNRSFFNDEIHQHRMAELRSRPIANRWIGMRIDDPPIDLAAIARAQGAVGLGPVSDVPELVATIHDAVARVRNGATVVVDVVTGPEPALPSLSTWLVETTTP